MVASGQIIKIPQVAESAGRTRAAGWRPIRMAGIPIVSRALIRVVSATSGRKDLNTKTQGFTERGHHRLAPAAW
jgi:hypothetical protein